VPLSPLRLSQPRRPPWHRVHDFFRRHAGSVLGGEHGSAAMARAFAAPQGLVLETLREMAEAGLVGLGPRGGWCWIGEDGAPLALNWTQVIAAIGDMREDRDEWKKRAESAEYALGPYLCPECKTCLSPKEFGHTMCRKCAEKDMAKRLGGGLLNLPDDWYDNTPDRGPQ